MQLPKLVVDNNPDIWGPSNDEFIKTTKELEHTFGGRHFTAIGVIAKKGTIYNEATLEKIARIQKDIEALPEAVKVNVFSLASSRVKDVRSVSDGLEADQMLAQWRSTKDPETIKAALQRNPLYVNSLVSADGSAAAVLADFKIDGEYTPLHEKLRKIVDAQRDESVEILMAGEPILSAQTERGMESLPRYFLIAFGIIALVQFYGFRSLQGMFLPLITAILAVLWTMGALASLSTVGHHHDGDHDCQRRAVAVVPARAHRIDEARLPPTSLSPSNMLRTARATLALLLACWLQLSLAASPQASDAAAVDVMKRNFAANRLKGYVGNVTLTVIESNQDKRHLKLKIWNKLQSDGVHTAVRTYFTAPPDLRGTEFLALERKDTRDASWVYLPGIDKIRRLPAASKRDSFFGTEFTYGDVITPEVGSFNHTMLPEEKIDGMPCFVVESAANNERLIEELGYGKRRSWIDKSLFLERRIQYYDVSGQLLRTLTMKGFKALDPDSGAGLMTQHDISNAVTGRRTALNYDAVEFNTSLKDGFFTLQALENAR